MCRKGRERRDKVQLSDFDASPNLVSLFLRRVAEQVGFGRLSTADGGKQYVSEAQAILSRA